MKVLARIAMVMLCFLATQAMAQVTATSPSNVEELRTALKRGTSINIGSTHIRSVMFSNEVRIPRGRTVIVVVGAPKGALALFKSDGTLGAVSETSRIISFQVFDLDENGTAGILTDEAYGSGTGVLIRRFKLYSFTNDQQVKVLWEGRSFLREAPWSPEKPNPKVSSEYGYVRVDPSGAGYPARMSYAFRDSSGQWTTKSYRLSHGAVQRLK